MSLIEKMKKEAIAIRTKEQFIKCHRCNRILGVVFSSSFNHRMWCEICGESEKYKRLERKK